MCVCVVCECECVCVHACVCMYVCVVGCVGADKEKTTCQSISSMTGTHKYSTDWVSGMRLIVLFPGCFNEAVGGGEAASRVTDRGEFGPANHTSGHLCPSATTFLDAYNRCVGVGKP